MTETDLATEPEHANVHDALRAVQKEIPHPEKKKTNPHFKSKYAGLDDLMDAVLPVITRHGLCWVTKPSVLGDKPSLEYELTHAASATAIVGHMLQAVEKNTPQGQGSGITYARRYSLESVLGTVGEDDDDGNAAEGRSPRSAAKRSAPKRIAAAPKMTAETKAAVRDAIKANGDEASVRAALTAVGVSDATAGKVSELAKGLTDKQGKDLVKVLDKKEKNANG